MCSGPLHMRNRQPLPRQLVQLAAMGVGTAAQQTPPVVRVDSGQLQGVVDDDATGAVSVRARQRQGVGDGTGAVSAAHGNSRRSSARFGRARGAGTGLRAGRGRGTAALYRDDSRSGFCGGASGVRVRGGLQLLFRDREIARGANDLGAGGGRVRSDEPGKLRACACTYARRGSTRAFTTATRICCASLRKRCRR